MAAAKPSRKMVAIPEELWWKLQEIRVRRRESSMERFIGQILQEEVDRDGEGS